MDPSSSHPLTPQFPRATESSPGSTRRALWSGWEVAFFIPTNIQYSATQPFLAARESGKYRLANCPGRTWVWVGTHNLCHIRQDPNIHKCKKNREPAPKTKCTVVGSQYLNCCKIALVLILEVQRYLNDQLHRQDTAIWHRGLQAMTKCSGTLWAEALPLPCSLAKSKTKTKINQMQQDLCQWVSELKGPIWSSAGHQGPDKMLYL